MSANVDKVVVSNRTAIRAKYGAAGEKSIYAALKRLVAADKARHLATIIIDIDDAALMKSLRGAAVVNAADQRGAKTAVDALYAFHTPDYIVLLDGPDVIPHIALNAIPGLTDGDKTIDSDLPYACSAGFGRMASNFLAVTRVVGRIPAATGETSPAKLIATIDASIAHMPRPVAAFRNYFALSAQVWNASTQLSLGAVFGNSAGLRSSPSDGHPGINADLAHRVHFINCHGAAGDPKFYGQQKASYPVAMDNGLLSAVPMSSGSLAAVECCFGAELYDYNLLGNAGPVCLSYMAAGATAYVGSTTIAYGPFTTNGQADLICQYFLQNALAGASTGRAFLQGRQNFIATQLMSNAMNLKTIAQFLLLGDPSLRAVAVSPSAFVTPAGMPVDGPAASEELDNKAQRKARRSVLLSEGKSVASFASLPGRKAKQRLPGVARFREIAKQRGFPDKPDVFEVTGGAAYKQSAKLLGQERQVAIVVEQQAWKGQKDDVNRPSYRVLVGHILGNGIFAVEESVSR